MGVHKLYCDSRAKKEGSHADWTWQPDRPIHVESSRAFVDSVHLPVVWETLGQDNNVMYVSEQLPLLTVASGINTLYLLETTASGTNYRTIQLDLAVYDGPALRTNLATKLSAAGTQAASWTVTYTASAQTLGSMTIESTGLVSWKLFSRRELVGLSSFGGSPLTKTALNDCCDLLGILESGVTGSQTATLNLSSALFYRQISLAQGFYTIESLATEMQGKLNTGTEMGANSYTVNAIQLTGRLQVVNYSSQTFQIFPESYLLANVYMFPGVGNDPYSSGNVTGLEGDSILLRNSITGSLHVNMLRYHTLFINCSLGTHNESCGPLSQSTLARKVVIDQANGMFVNDYHSLPYDYISLEKQSISAIRFRLTDWRGRAVTMAAHWSLSLIIFPQEDF